MVLSCIRVLQNSWCKPLIFSELCIRSFYETRWGAHICIMSAKSKFVASPSTAASQSLSEELLELEEEEEEDSCFLFFCFFLWFFPCSLLFFLLFFLWLFSFFFFFLLSSSSDEEYDLLRFFFFFVASSSLDEADLRSKLSQNPQCKIKVKDLWF